MPQMAPLSWLSLFFYFTLIFLMFNSMNYFSFIYKNKSSKLNKSMLKYSWKW
uniref:ATP synthase complex subunit 8 n=1 Tax=Kateretes pedicularius TaxID=877986 RepID=S4SV10_9CUCU|nr:ATP synthase F0 subunit 8 [Kateretes pedicularius]